MIPLRRRLLYGNQIQMHLRTNLNKNLRIVNGQKTDITASKRSTSKKQANQKGRRSLKTLRNFSQKQIHSIWFDSDIFLLTLEETRSKTNHTNTYAARILTWSVELILHKHDARKYALDNNYNPTPAEFDYYFYRLADAVWPHALALTEKDLMNIRCQNLLSPVLGKWVWDDYGALDYHRLCS